MAHYLLRSSIVTIGRRFLGLLYSTWRLLWYSHCISGFLKCCPTHFPFPKRPQGLWTIIGSARQNSDASKWENLLPTTLGCPSSWLPSPVWLTPKYLPNPAFPLVHITAQGAPHTFSPWHYRYWARNIQKHNPGLGFCSILAFPLLIHDFNIPFKIQLDQTQCYRVFTLISFQVSQSSRLCFIQVTAPSSPGNLMWTCMPSSPATGRQSGSPAGSPQASVPGCQFQCWWLAARCFQLALPCALGWSSTGWNLPWWRWRTGCRVLKTRRRGEAMDSTLTDTSLRLPSVHWVWRVTFS